MTSAVQDLSESSQVRILNVEPAGYSHRARSLLEQLGDITDGPLTRPALLAALPEFDILIVRLAHQIDREVLEAARRLKIIVSGTTGLDHVDLDTARTKGITVLSLRGETEFLQSVTATAEMTWGLLLALMRRIPEAVGAVRAGAWDRDAVKGRDLSGKRLGIVGLGRVGRQIAEFGAAFKMTVSAYDPGATLWPETVQRRSSLADLLRDSDVLSLHVNLHPGTINLISHRELALLPRGGVLVNTSRGDVVDADALVDALEAGQLSGAALDVIPHERHQERRRASRLLAYAMSKQNLLITPHAAGATVEAMHRTEEFMAHKLLTHCRPTPAVSVSHV